MATSALDIIKREASMRIASANRRAKTQGLQRMLVRKASLVGSAGLYGALNRMGVPIQFAGFPWKLAVSTAANLAEAMTGGNVQAVMAGIADSTTAIYIERSISTGTLIAGDYEVAIGQGSDGGSI